MRSTYLRFSAAVLMLTAVLAIGSQYGGTVLAQGGQATQAATNAPAAKGWTTFSPDQVEGKVILPAPPAPFLKAAQPLNPRING